MGIHKNKRLKENICSNCKAEILVMQIREDSLCGDCVSKKNVKYRHDINASFNPHRY